MQYDPSDLESRWLLNIAYNVGAERIPYPTTAGDFLRRFGPEDLLSLQEAINEIRKKVWAKKRSKSTAH